MSAKQSKKRRKVIIKESEQIIMKLATDELKEHYARVYGLWIAEKKKNMILLAKIHGAKIILGIGLLLTAGSVWVYLSK